MLVSRRQGGVKFGRGNGAGEASGERRRREVCASASAGPSRVRCRMRVSPRVMGRELTHVCKQPQNRYKILNSICGDRYSFIIIILY
jgi:hypothetical protein